MTHVPSETCPPGCVSARFPSSDPAGPGVCDRAGKASCCRDVLSPDCSSNLAGNRIGTLEPGAFDGLSRSLLTLRLSKNRITQLPVKAFRLPRLTQL